MAEQNHKLRFDFIANTKNFDKAIKKSSTTISSFSKDIGQVGKEITMKFTAPLLLAGGVAIKQAAKFERLQVTLDTLTGSADKGAEAFERLVKFSAETPLQLEELTRVNNMLMGFGLSTEDAFNSLKMLGDISAITGGNLTGIAVAFGQAAAEGRVMTRDIRQFINNGVPMLKLLALELGVARSEIMNMATEGKITFEILNNAFKNATSEGGQFNNGLQILSQTITGLFSTLKDNLNIALAELGNEIVEILDLKNGIPKLTKEIRNTTDAFINLNPKIKTAAFNLAELVGKGGLIALGIGLFAKFGKKIKTLKADVVAKLGPAGALIATMITTLAVAMDIFDVSIENVFRQIGKAQTAPAEIFKLKTVEARKQLTDLQDEIRRTTSKLTIPSGAFTDPLGFLGMRPNALPITPIEKPTPPPKVGNKIDFTKMLDFDKFFTRDLPERLKVGFVDTVKGFKTELDFTTVFGDIAFSMRDLTTNAIIPLGKSLKKNNEMIMAFATTIGSTLVNSFANLTEGEDAFKKIGEQLEALIKRLLVAAGLSAIIAAVFGLDFRTVFAALSGMGSMMSPVPNAKGGIYSGPTNALVGEYPGARSNPEVIAPLNKLKGMLGNSGGAMQGEFVLRGQDLVVALQRAERNRNRFK